ncbi:alkaline phosphatase [Plebeiibacterium sediminum]|uniref:Alkaline phosphatase n=1 Tax=Plebeiibacterium sediminum TaxID=2992112 RepID=A0AAE3SFK6_9BACT|nr:alkaline phosphatase [Plebeiobacterium sediminum]MCW3786288.1 alkaline phosphatase [Plebeiobacterium sediminum]
MIHINKKQIIYFFTGCMAIFFMACNSKIEKEQEQEQELHNSLIGYESKYWYKRSLAHVLLNRMESEKNQVLWGTTYHTAAPVPLGSVGPAKYTRKLQGIIQNDSLGRVLKSAVSDGINVVLVIGDGMGNMHMALPIYKRYAENNKKQTYFEKIMSEGSCGYMHTGTARGVVTGSAASGTAIASGTKTMMNMVGVDPNGNPLLSALDCAKQSGYYTAVVSDAGITDATPAAFYAHSVNRDLESDIALQLAQSNKVDLILGGGAGQFIPQNSSFSDYYTGTDYPEFTSSRNDNLNLFKIFEEQGYQLCFTVQELKNCSANRIVGLFDGGGLKPAVEYRANQTFPTISQLADKAMKVTSRQKQPSFTMIECARIDWEAHDNDMVSVYKAVEEMNNILEVAYARYHKDPKHTLLIFTADHETGGLEIAYKDVEKDQGESFQLPSGDTYTNHTYPLFYEQFLKELEGQDKTISSILSISENAAELQNNLLKHAGIKLNTEEAEMLFYAKHDYKKYKLE